MEPIDYVRLLRRRWRLLAACVFVGALVAWVTTPPRPSDDQIDYAAEHVLLRDTAATSPVPALAQVALFVRSGEVPRRVAERIGYDGNPGRLANQIAVDVDETAGSLVITATDSTQQGAADLANAFAEETLGYFGEQAQHAQQNLLQQASDDATSLGAQLNDLESQLAVAEATGAPTGALEAQVQAKIQEYAGALEQENQLQDLAPPSAGYISLEPASADLATPTNGGFSAPRSRPARVGLAVLLSLLLGMGAVLIAERVDPRVHTRESVELAFDLPVVAEVPRERGRNHHTITSVLEPLSASAEAHRSVRATVLLTPVSQLGRRRGRASEALGEHAAEPQVLLVTSPAPGDGKTTTVANLAAVFAEMGRSVLLLGCDFRRPEIHKYFGSPTHPGTSDVLTGSCALADVVRPTDIEGVSIAPTGSGLRKLGDLAAAGVSLVESARELADVVIIDTAPMLATNDAAELVHAVDAVILVARSGRTTIQSARRVRALLDRLSAPVVGVVLIGAPETESSYSAYSPYTVRSKPSRRRAAARPPAPEKADDAGVDDAEEAVVPAQAQARPAPAPVTPPATVPETVLEPRRRLRSAPPRPAG